jgi:hypothetical protein
MSVLNTIIPQSMSSCSTLMMKLKSKIHSGSVLLRGNWDFFFQVYNFVFMLWEKKRGQSIWKQSAEGICSETSIHHSHMRHFPASIVHSFQSQKSHPFQQGILISDISFLEVSSSHICHSDFLVLSHSIRRMIVSDKYVAKCRRMRCVGHIPSRREIKSTWKILFGNVTEESNFDKGRHKVLFESKVIFFL